MADQSQKALNLASGLVSAADQLMTAVETLRALKDAKESSGIDFTAAEIEAALAASSLRHVDGNMLNSVLSSGAALEAWLTANFHDDNFHKVRP